MPVARAAPDANSGPTERGDALADRLILIATELARELHPAARRAQPLGLDSHLERDWGFDSLARMELLLRIERGFAVGIPERWLGEAETLRQLMPVIATARTIAPAVPRQTAAPADTAAVPLPHAAASLTEVLDFHAEKNGGRPHIVLPEEGGGERILTYGELAVRARRAAAFFRSRGIEAGSRVALMLPTGLDFFVTFFAILYARAVPTPLYPPMRATEIEDHLRRQSKILDNAQAEILVAVAEAHRAARLLELQVPSLKTVVTPEEISAAEAEPQLTRGGGPAEAALFQYTSGSTGDPKGVVLTHRNLLANIRAMGTALQASSSDVFVSWLPLYHDMGLIGAWLGSLYYGVPVVIMSPLSFLVRPERWLWTIHRYRGTISAAPNFAFELCTRKIEESAIAGLDLSSLRAIANGAEAVSADTIRRFTARFGPYGFRREAMLPVYGLAENAVGLAFPSLGRAPIIDRVDRAVLAERGIAAPARVEDPTAAEFVCCGRPLPGHELRILDADGEAGERREGRIQFRGPSATSGYFRNDAKNRELLEAGWLNTGDLGYLADGELFITGRAKDIIIRAGRHIYPTELEEAVGNLPGIRRGCVAAFGSRDPGSGTERLVVIAETRATSPETMVALRDAVAAALDRLLDAPPEDIVIVPPHTVPKTSSGKLRRAAMRELYEGGRLIATTPGVRWQILRLLISAAIARSRRALERVKSTLYDWYAWTVIGLGAALAWPTVILLPKRAWRWRLLRGVLRGIFHLMAIRIRVETAEPPPRNAIFVANHASYIDGLVLSLALPGDVAFVAKSELAGQFFAGRFLRALGACFVERADPEAGVEDVRRVAATAIAGRPLVFFPEGTFTRADGLQEFHLGAFHVAVETGLPIVPVAVRGTRSILRSDQWRIRRGDITVRIGSALATGGSDFAATIDLRDRARRSILAHCGEPDLLAR
jgi:1-acyl-sn-glycerol-3-phosphate acyltransferase